MENKAEEKLLISDGTYEKTYIHFVNTSISVYSEDGLKRTPWDGNKVFELLNDGRRYRLLKKAEEIKKEETE